MSESGAILHAQGLNKTYTDGAEQRQVLRDLSLTVLAGEFVVLWGPSGSGKSTLLNILAGVIPADSGSIELCDTQGRSFQYGAEDVNATTQLRRQLIGYVFQFFNLVPTLTVRENIDLVLRLAGKIALAESAYGRANSLQLEHRLDVFPEVLSGGEQQRAAVARALAHAPSLVLADEPTGNLDANNASRVMDALLAALDNTACALVVATHDERVAQRAHTVLEMA